MTKYESSIKYNAAPIDRVYAKLSDLTNLRALQERCSDPAFLDVIKEKSNGQVSEEQISQLQERLQNLQFDRDSVGGHVDQLGMDVTLRIIEREEPKLVKMELEGSPIPANLWIQLLPAPDGGTRMKLTVGVELNFFMRKMVEGKLKGGVEQFADMLATIPY